MAESTPQSTEEIVYGVWDPWVVFLPRSEADQYARLCEALSSKTWGGARQVLLPAEYQDLLERGHVGEEPPADDEELDLSRLSGEDATWPRDPRTVMYVWVPDEVQEVVGEIGYDYGRQWAVQRHHGADGGRGRSASRPRVPMRYRPSSRRPDGDLVGRFSWTPGQSVE